ncbi:MAG: TonB-dependent receptor [Cryomorphaceae bacterium]|nr:TonB-dependent receptor [Cryomorphaceae bacterium]
MKSRVFFALLLITPMLSWGSSNNSNSADEDRNRYNVTGFVFDKDANLLAGATVQLLKSNHTTLTDAYGAFKLARVVEGTYTLEVRYLGYVTLRKEIDVNSDINMGGIVLKEDQYMLMQSTVISERDHLFRNVPGTVRIMDKEEIDRLQPLSGNEVLRRTPGVNPVDEDGVGLRLNIGIRGLDPDRSRNVLILEDGVPIALNPYGEPEMYYSPSIDRMDGVEIIKGSGQILYGPQTLGGVINFITADPPQEETYKLRVQAGEGGFRSIHAQYGNTFEKTGMQISYLRKEAEALGPLNFALDDVNAKFRIPINERSVLGVKISAYNEQSNATYLGMTQRMFDMGGDDFRVLAPNDHLSVKRFAGSVNHRYNAGNNVIIHSTFFANQTTRDWRRQDFAYNQHDENGNITPENYTQKWGDTSVAGGAIYLFDRTGSRNRTFQVAGWEQKLQWKFNTGELVSHDLQVGYRYMFERAFEQRINGTFAEARSGELVNDEVRTGHAFSAYILDRIKIGDKLELSPGVRIESYTFEREVLRQRSVDTLITANNEIFSIIPGVGASFSLFDELNVYGGVHRGYAPPRVKDALDFTFENPVLDLDAELSWNYEFGMRTQLTRGLQAEAALFLLDFANQIIPASESAGDAFGVVNAGATVNRGVEASVNLNTRDAFKTNWLMLLDGQMTYLHAVFNNDRMVNGESVRGNRLPYAPEWMLSAAATVEAPFGTGVRLTYSYMGEQFTDEANTVTPSANGRFGRMDAFQIIDLTVYHHIPKWNTRFNVAIKNITDERYIATRRPRGITMGLPRMITAGFDIQF